VSTKSRSSQLLRLLESLAAQTRNDFELIVVEQNEISLVADMLKGPWNFPINYIHSPNEQGVSRGRNRGLREARADIVLFPDDDCWYPANFMARGLQSMQEQGLDALTGRPTDAEGHTIDGRFETKAHWITKSTVWTTQIEWLAFWRTDLLRRLGGFDESVGVGATTPWQSAEGQELMLRALKAGAHCWYDPDLNAHDAGVDRLHADASTIAKARSYGRGMGYVLRKERLARKSFYYLARSAGGVVAAAARGQLRLSRYHAATLMGRAEGLMGICFR
jgi:glycosyltransferase involved in cell wall biosynthesis